MRTIISTGSKVSAFLIHTESISAQMAEYLLLGHSVHTNKNTEYRAKGNQIIFYMSVGNLAVIGSPVVHYILRRLKRALSCHSRRKLCTVPCAVCAFLKRIIDILEQSHCLALIFAHYFCGHRENRTVPCSV